METPIALSFVKGKLSLEIQGVQVPTHYITDISFFISHDKTELSLGLSVHALTIFKDGIVSLKEIVGNDSLQKKAYELLKQKFEERV